MNCFKFNMNTRLLVRGTQVGTAILMLASLCSGCSGINATKSISPLDFILPGLTGSDPAVPTIAQTESAFASNQVPDHFLSSTDPGLSQSRLQ
jgi:hypothetical protein